MALLEDEAEPLISKDEEPRRRNPQRTCCGPPPLIDFDDMDLTATQRYIIQDYRMNASQPYTKESKEAEDAIKGIWAAVSPDLPLPSRIGSHWKTIGFQGADPATDVRGAGVFGLQYLERGLSSYPYLVTLARRSEQSYPFAASALNVIRMLVCHLNLTLTVIVNQHPPETVLRGFANLVTSSRANALFHLYVAGLVLLQHNWEKAQADPTFHLLRFHECLVPVRQTLLKFLSSGGTSVDALMASLSREVGRPVNLLSPK